MQDTHLENIQWAQPAAVPETTLIGREEVLGLCRAAWGLDKNYRPFQGSNQFGRPRSLHFRLEGAPGVGKNAIVYEIARRLRGETGVDLYMMAGHEEMTPEDLTLLIVPYASRSGVPFTIRASPLATAIRRGGLFFFDEINRVPERALSPLASVLDERQEVLSAMTGMTIWPENDDARKRFRFCCALNPNLGDSGYVLPDYIEQRTLPAIQVENPPLSDLLEIVRNALDCDDEWLLAFTKLYDQGVLEAVSIRQALLLMAYALRTEESTGGSRENAVRKVLPYFLRSPAMANVAASGQQSEKPSQAID